MNNLSVGMKCLIIGSPYKETEGNIGKVVELIEFSPGIGDFNGWEIDCWEVQGDNLLTSVYNYTSDSYVGEESQTAYIRPQYLMPLDPLKETEQDKQETLVF